jgi:glycosyltransferase involved in cell wall biosynthesis
MALGVPVVTSDDPAMCELGGGATQVFAVGDPTALSDAIASVLNDAPLKSRMIESGRIRARAFDWQDSAITLWGLYSGLAG